jgi:hypothetical protein
MSEKVIKVEYKDLEGKIKIISLNLKDKENDHWHINEEPYVIYEKEIVNGKYVNEINNKVEKAINSLFKSFEPSSNKLNIFYRKAMSAFHFLVK